MYVKPIATDETNELAYVLYDDIGCVGLVDTIPNTNNIPENGFVSPLDAAIVEAARASYDSGLKGYEKDASLLQYLINNNHTSPLEMVEYKFYIKAPMLVAIHFLRHRTASINMQSYRYMAADYDDVYIPQSWRVQSKKNKQKSIPSDYPVTTILDPQTGTYDNANNLLEAHVKNSFELYQSALDEGISREQARLFLPAYALYTSFIFKIDLHNLVKMLKQRNSPNAQWETQQYAIAMQRFVRQHNPIAYEYFLLYEHLNPLP